MMKRMINRTISALLAFALLVMPLLALAEGGKGEATESIDSICLEWLEQIEKGTKKNRGFVLQVNGANVAMEDALRTAAETLIRMGYETEQTLSGYTINMRRPNFVYGNAWLVNLQPLKGGTDADMYSVEVNMMSGELVSIAFSDLYAYGGQESTSRTLTIRETIAEAPVYGKDARELANALMMRAESTLGGGMPQPFEGTDYVKPSDKDIPRVDALEAVIAAAISEGSYALGDLYTYRAGFSITEDAAGRRVWSILLVPPEILATPYIRCRVDARTGDVLTFDIVATTDREMRSITDEEAYKALVAYWKAQQYGSFDLFNADGFNGRPAKEEVPLDAALRTAVEMILNLSDLSMDALYTYLVDACFYESGCGVEGLGYTQRGWLFHFGNWTEDNIPGLINVVIDAKTGECTDIVFAHSQFVNPSVSTQAALLAREDLMAVVDGWKERSDGAFTFAKTAVEDFGVFYYSPQEEYGIPRTRDCAPEAALCAALDSVARMTGKNVHDFADADVTLRYNGSRNERRHYIIDMEMNEQRYIVEVESPAVWLMRILLSQEGGA